MNFTGIELVWFVQKFYSMPFGYTRICIGFRQTQLRLHCATGHSYLISWLDLSEEYIGGTLGFVQLPLPHADPLLPPQLIGAIYSRYVFGAPAATRTRDTVIKSHVL